MSGVAVAVRTAYVIVLFCHDPSKLSQSSTSRLRYAWHDEARSLRRPPDAAPEALRGAANAITCPLGRVVAVVGRDHHSPTARIRAAISQVPTAVCARLAVVLRLTALRRRACHDTPPSSPRRAPRSHGTSSSRRRQQNVPTTYGSPSPLNPALLAEPATHPGLPSLTIICDMLPWSITITPSRTHFVSVGDVLHALYRMLRLAVTETEVGVLPPDTRVRVHSAFHARHKMLPDARSRAEEKQKGVKRVDFLMDLRRFAGLSIVMSGAALNGKGLGEVWALQLAMA
ncbi:hypothetical protein EVJ58_g2983 [Rhodofomes roseus]|uniref:DUF6699 domain-containing protein n=1 Tax=Rhodofomes roseus TaxID=34475 RepID=A0A4Y9YN93_9APHY|nr:hypothetical protein EVJ58_g2983 [Rhodofomes roseus]